MSAESEQPSALPEEESALPSRKEVRAAHEKAAGAAKPRRFGFLRELVVIVVLALALSGIVKHFLVQNFEIPSGSMENTLEVGDRIAVSRLVPRWRDLHRGDIIVFSDSQQWLPQENGSEHKVNAFQSILISLGVLPEQRNQYLVKRVIGLPGDHVSCCTANNEIQVNGTAVREPYLKPGAAASQRPFDVVVPPGKLWVMGDNRNNSSDSRAHMGQPGKGFVPISDVTGRAFLRWWPLSRWGLLDSGSKAFEQVR